MFTINRAWLENTTSRSAFYQAFQIRGDVGRTVTVAHYGKLVMAKEGKFSRPVRGGNVKVIGSSYADALAAKLKGDYVRVDTQKDLAVDLGELTTYLTQMFGASDTHTILTAMGLISAGMTLGEDDPEPSPRLPTDYSSAPGDELDAELDELLNPTRGSW